ncbi:MAG: hypothetical protein V3580_02850 [Candidatus Cardinium sp.]
MGKKLENKEAMKEMKQIYDDAIDETKNLKDQQKDLEKINNL